MKIFLVIFFILKTLHLTAQEGIVSFSVLSNDLSASTERRLDEKGMNCALIKIQTMDKIVKIEGNVIGKLILKGQETWAFMKAGSTSIKLLFENSSPLDLVFADYGVEALESKVAYSLEMLTASDDSLNLLEPMEVAALADKFYDNQEYGKAVRYYMNAANRGVPMAQYNLADCYRNGYGVPKNYSKMLHWYETSINKGCSLALFGLAECYLWGIGIDIDYKKAFEMFTNVTNVVLQTDTLAHAYDALGYLYLNGLGVAKNVDNAFALYEKAANMGYEGSQYNLGTIYFEGKIVDRNEKEAVRWFRKAAENGFAAAQNNLGVCYLFGKGVEKDYSQAVAWFQKAAEQKCSSGYYSLGICYNNGYGVPTDYVKAVECYRMAAEQGLANAQYNLARCYYEGKGVDTDIDKAVCWYKKAAEQGYKDADNKLKEIEINSTLLSKENNELVNKNIVVPVKAGINIEMIRVEPGSFYMGSEDEIPIHYVSLSNGYYIGKYEITQAQWQAVMGNNPSYFKGDDLPVVNVSWNDCMEFIEKLNKQTNKRFRLPTEAEWEYAAKGGNEGRGYLYSGSNTLRDVAWYYDNSEFTLHAVGKKQPNGLGIYDMSGNTWEWCQDWKCDYSDEPQTNPNGPTSGEVRVCRGGSWANEESVCRLTFRFGNAPDRNSGDLGVRLVLSD